MKEPAKDTPCIFCASTAFKSPLTIVQDRQLYLQVQAWRDLGAGRGGRDLIRRIPAYTCRHPQILFPEGQNQSCMFWRINDGNETFCDFLLSAGAESVSENVSLFFYETSV